MTTPNKDHPAYDVCIIERACTKHENLSDCPISHLKASRSYCREWKPGEPSDKGILCPETEETRTEDFCGGCTAAKRCPAFKA